MEKKILEYNDAYRNGTPVISDEEFDNLLDVYKSKFGELNYKRLKVKLFEKNGEITHRFKVGSLNKCTYGTGQILNWVKKYNVKKVYVTDKIDGMSIVCNYENGELISAATRGDGTYGEDITDKALLIKDIPKVISYKGTLSLRGELLVTEEGAIKNNYQNRRNGTVGIIKRKNVTDDLKYIQCYFHGVLGDFSIRQQIDMFTMLNFDNFPADIRHVHFDEMIVDDNIEERLRQWMEVPSANSYICDGFVIYNSTYVNENSLHPEEVVAFKVNKEGVVTTVKDIEWKTSKNGNIKPVVILESVYIDGTTVSRATGYNWRFVSQNKIGTGAHVKIVKSGEIIPKIINVIKEGKFQEPDCCPACGSKSLGNDGTELSCMNEECCDQEVKALQFFLHNCDVKGTSTKSLQNWNLFSIKDIIEFKPESTSKNQVKFYKEIQEKVLSRQPGELFAKMSYNGAGEKTITKLIEANGSIENLVQSKSFIFPEGVGAKTMENIKDDIKKNYDDLCLILADPRYEEKEEVGHIAKSNKLNGKSFILTGELKLKRKDVEEMIIDNGGVVAGAVNKKLDYLIVGSSPGSKLKKAQEIGVQIITEDQFWNMIK